MEQQPILATASRFVDEFLADLGGLVTIDSGSYTPDGVARVADVLQPRFAERGWTVERIPGVRVGPHLIARTRGEGRGRILLIGHMDTVFADGETERRPFAVRDGRAYGPGVLDMKGGLLIGLYALRVLSDLGEAPFEAVTFLLNSDEEIGSPESSEIVARLAQEADVALVLEPTADVERLTVSRKGVGMFRLDVSGISSHAGADPKRGRSAILELAHRIVALHALNDTIHGVTVNVGVVEGGDHANVIADAAHALIDVCVLDPEGKRRIEDELQRVVAQTIVENTSVTLTGHFAHDPFQQSEASALLFALAKEEAVGLGLSLRGEPSGGASDGNTTAALGVPTLDGLGVVGGLAHNPGEYVDVAAIAPRIALLATIIRRVGEWTHPSQE
ncbi:MAG: M20 family metallopeptidase [Ktedonobacterales bacterium]